MSSSPVTPASAVMPPWYRRAEPLLTIAGVTITGTLLALGFALHNWVLYFAGTFMGPSMLASWLDDWNQRRRVARGLPALNTWEKSAHRALWFMVCVLLITLPVQILVLIYLPGWFPSSCPLPPRH